MSGLSEDQAVAAFAEFMSGEGSTTADPGKLLAEQQAAARTATANKELKDLSTNEATSAFACLVDSQVIQQKAATYEGSGKQAEEETARFKKRPGATAAVVKRDPLLAVQQQSEAELAQANQQIEVTETAQQAAAQLGGPANIAAVQESAVTVAGAGVLVESDLAQGSKLQQQINQLKSGYTVQDLKKPKERQAAAEKKPAGGAK